MLFIPFPRLSTIGTSLHRVRSAFALGLLIATGLVAKADSSHVYKLSNNTETHSISVPGASATFQTYQPHEYVESCEAQTSMPTTKRNVDIGLKLDILKLDHASNSEVVTVNFTQTNLIEIRSVQIFECRIDIPQFETISNMSTFSMQPGTKHKIAEYGNQTWYLERMK